VAKNEITGTLPTEYGKLELLTDLVLGINLIRGTIPTEIGKLKSMANLDLQNNYFEGTIPTKISQLKNISRIYLDSNSMEGTIRDFYFEHLTYLSIYHNFFSGPVPWKFAENATALNTINFQFNRFTGTVPAALLQSSFPRIIYLANNFLPDQSLKKWPLRNSNFSLFWQVSLTTLQFLNGQFLNGNF